MNVRLHTMRQGLFVVVLLISGLVGLAPKNIVAQEVPSQDQYRVFLPAAHRSVSLHPLKPSTQIGGALTALAVAGNRAFVAEGPRIVIYDVSKPDEPLELGRSAPLPALVQGLSVQDDTLYVVTEDGAGQVFDARSPADLRPLGPIPATEPMEAFLPHGEFGIVCDTRGIRVMRLLGEGRMEEAARLELHKGARDCILGAEGTRLLAWTHFYPDRSLDPQYVVGIDLSNPLEPVSRGVIAQSSSPGRSGVTAFTLDPLLPRAYILESTSASGTCHYIQAVDWSQAEHPKYLDHRSLENCVSLPKANWIAADGDSLLAGTERLWSLDVSDPNAMEIRGFSDASGLAAPFILRDDRAFVLGDGFSIWDLNVPGGTGGPVQRSIRYGFGIPIAMELEGNAAYVLTRSPSRLRILELDRTGEPRQVYEEANSASALLWQNGKLILKEGTSLRILRLGNPGAAPQIIGSLNRFVEAAGRGQREFLAYRRGTLYVVAFGLRAYDLRWPENPTPIESRDFGSILPNILAFSLDSERAHALSLRSANDHDSPFLQSLNFDESGDPVLVGTATLPLKGVRDMVVENRVAYVIHSEGLSTFDVANPILPHALDSIAFSARPSVLDQRLDLVWVTDEVGTIHAVDVSDQRDLREIRQSRVVGQVTDIVPTVGRWWLLAGRGGLVGLFE